MAYQEQKSIMFEQSGKRLNNELSFPKIGKKQIKMAEKSYLVY